jgi:hypothetical protein
MHIDSDDDSLCAARLLAFYCLGRVPLLVYNSYCQVAAIQQPGNTHGIFRSGGFVRAIRHPPLAASRLLLG